MKVSKRIILAGFAPVVLLLYGCGPDCQGLRGTVKNGLGGSCTAAASSSSNAPASVSVSAAANFVATGGATVQFTALTTYNSGASSDTTSLVTWSLSNASVGAIDSDGLFTSSGTGGITTVTATHDGVSSARTLKVVGTVTDVTVGTAPIAAIARPGSSEIWVLNNDTSNQISVLNTATNAVTQTINVGAGNGSNNLVFLSDGSKAYFTTAGPPHRIWVIDGATKASSLVTVTTSYGVQPAVSPGDAFVYYAQNGGTSDVFRIDTSTDTAASFDTTPACPTGLVITSLSKMFVSDQCHGGSDWIYVYNSYLLTASTNFSISPFVANRLYASPDGSRVFAVANPPDDTRMLNGTTNAVLDSVAGYGQWGFLNDNSRVIHGKHAASYSLYDYTGATLSLIENLPGLVNPNNGGLAAATADDTLYLPVGGSNTVRVYQYHD
ncbi:MAG TPA: hypothetical protein VFV50_06310 [Bdellovibrionales bacterium]|nr:hypothetical protein [Bdellovibrionales bacterium]